MSSAAKTPNAIVDPVSEMTCGHCGVAIDVSGATSFTRIQCPACGGEQTVPARLGTFLLQDLLGAGGMGDVYCARDESLGRLVAIKVMQPSLGQNRDFVENFKREAQAAAKLNHPHIAQIYSFGEANGQPYIVMELVSGQRLDRMIVRDAPLNQALVLRIGLDIADGLSAADEIGLIHGDIKPENILLDEKMNAKLVDFGLATFAHQVEEEGIWGTPYYIAPEKIRRQKVDARSDIYSLGATLYHALAGRAPFEGETPIEVVKARLEQSPPELHDMRPDIDAGVASIIARMLQLEPARRYPTYASLISDIRKVLDTLAPSTSVRSRKIIVGKRKKPIRAALPPNLAAAGPAASSASGKIAVSTRQSGLIPSQPGADTTAPDSQPDLPSAKGKSRAKRLLKALLWLVLIGGLIGGGVYMGLRTQQEREMVIAAKREQLALNGQREEAGRQFAAIEGVVAGVQAVAARAPALVAEVTNAVFCALAENFEAFELNIEPEAPPEPAAPTPAAAEEEAAAAPAADTHVAAAVAADTTNATPPAAEGEPAAAETSPEATATNADVVVEGATAAEPPAEPTEAPAAVEAEPPATTPVEEPELKRLAREVIAGVRSIMTGAARSSGILSEAAGLRDAALNAPSSLVASNQVAQLSGLLHEGRRLQENVKQVSKDAGDKARKVGELRVRAEADLAARKQREEEEARQKEAEEAARRKEEEIKSRVEQELAAVRDNRAACATLVQQNRFKEAAEKMRATGADIQTDQAKEALRAVVDRYERLQRLKLFIVERLNTDPFQWGLGVGASARDILSADETMIRARGRDQLWTEIGPAQMIKFFKRYLESEKLRASVLGEHNLAAAVYCLENGGDEALPQYTAKARELLVFYRDKALSFSPSLRSESQRLLPGID